MAAKKGVSFLLKAGNGASSEVFTTIAAQRTTSLSINGTQVDVTDKDSSGWQELLAGGSIRSMAISAAGVYKDVTSQILIESRCLARTLDNYQIVFDGGRTYEGAFQVISVEYAGEHNGEHTYSASLVSSGAVTVQAGGS
ncbi:MAG: phage major tail protein, TP901-1 family [Dehalococcoidia bacterium]|nr:phage major tail protein, TP901-1 family [Dehalococcoidia bacterium]